MQVTGKRQLDKKFLFSDIYIFNQLVSFLLVTFSFLWNKHFCDVAAAV